MFSKKNVEVQSGPSNWKIGFERWKHEKSRFTQLKIVFRPSKNWWIWQFYQLNVGFQQQKHGFNPVKKRCHMGQVRGYGVPMGPQILNTSEKTWFSSGWNYIFRTVTLCMCMYIYIECVCVYIIHNVHVYYNIYIRDLQYLAQAGSYKPRVSSSE